MNILFVQHGNYGQAWQSFRDGGPETYRDQRISVDYVSGLAQQHSVTVLALCDVVHDTELAPGLRSIGVVRADFDAAAVAALMQDVQPDLLICRSPVYSVLRAAGRRDIPTLACFADIFAPGGLRTRLRNRRLRQVLAGSNVVGVANHSLNASRSLARTVGVPPERIIPWDWSRISELGPVKTQVADATRPRLFFAGAMTADKGVGDCLSALRLLHDRGIAAELSLAGREKSGEWREMAARLGLQDAVHFLGLIPNTDVRRRMMAHDIVTVPSRHSYPEGLPNTLYEALASRSALVVSDHPAFEGRIGAGHACMEFAGSDPAALAEAVAQLCQDPALYARLSENAEKALDGLYFGIEWTALMDHFIADPANHGGWVARHALPVLEAAQH